MDRDALRELLAKVEDGLILVCDGDKWRACGVDVNLAVSAFNGSLAAAKALHEDLLHESAWGNISYSKRYAEEARAEITLASGTWQAVSINPARAWLIAILSALIAEGE